VNARAAPNATDKALWMIQVMKDNARRQADTQLQADTRLQTKVKPWSVKTPRWNRISMCAVLLLLVSIFGLLFVGREGNIGSFLSVFNNLNFFSTVHNGDYRKHMDEIRDLNERHALQVQDLNDALKVQELKVGEWIAEVAKTQTVANAANYALIEQKQVCSAERKKQDAKIADLEYGMRRLRGETWHAWFDFSKGYYPYILPFFFGAAGVYVAMSVWKFLCVHGQDPLMLGPSHPHRRAAQAAAAQAVQDAADLAAVVLADAVMAAQQAARDQQPAPARDQQPAPARNAVRRGRSPARIAPGRAGRGGN